MKSSFSRVLSVAMGAALAVGTMLATVPANAAPAAGTNLVPDAGLRACIADQWAYNGLNLSRDSITQADFDAMAAATTSPYTLGCGGVSSLEGLQYLNDPELNTMEFFQNSITDLTPLAGFTNLEGLQLNYNNISDLTPLAGLINLSWLILDHNQISDLTPLSGLTNLGSVDLSYNQISDLTPLAGLTSLRYLELSNNQISDVTPLAGLTGLTGRALLSLDHNQISDISPLVSMINAGAERVCPDTEDTDCFSMNWTLSGNQITDVSSLDWDQVGGAWLTIKSEYVKDVYYDTVTDQTAVQTATSGTTVALPEVKAAANDPYPLTWTVSSGDATIDQAAGTITYNSVGPVQLAWADSRAINCADFTGKAPVCKDNAATINLSFFSGTVSVNVSEAGTPPVPSIPESDVAKDKVVASTTGGAARVADGTDSYTLVTTVKDENGVALNGYVDHLSATSAKQVSLSAFTANGDGTYSLVVKSDTPGNYSVAVLLDGSVIQTIPVNFIAADVAQPSRTAGEVQSAAGLGFLAGEKVTVTLHSDPIDLGTATADSNGTVSVSFTLPSDLAVGRHTVEFVGEVSGTAVVGFDVVSSLAANTGGTSSPASGSAVVALLFAVCVAAGFSLLMGLRKRTY